MFELEIQAKSVTGMLVQAAHAMEDASPLMASISNELASQTDENFSAEGRPKWLGLKPSTIAKREKRGTWPGMILKVNAGGLADSISASSDADSATVGSNKVYAAIHQLGGQAGRGRKVTIPARPFLPMDAQGNLQQEAEQGILDVANHYLETRIG